MEQADSDKHASLLRQGISYSVKTINPTNLKVKKNPSFQHILAQSYKTFFDLNFADVCIDRNEYFLNQSHSFKCRHFYSIFSKLGRFMAANTLPKLLSKLTCVNVRISMCNLRI